MPTVSLEYLPFVVGESHHLWQLPVMGTASRFASLPLAMLCVNPLSPQIVMPKVSTLQEYDVDISPRTRTTLVVAQEYARDAGAWVHSYEDV